MPCPPPPFNGHKSLPDAVDAKEALSALEQHFTLGLTSPALVLVDAGPDGNIFAADIQAGSDALIRSVEAETASPENRDAPYGAPIQTEINDGGNTEELRVPINADTGEDEAIDAVEHLRDDLIPAAFGDGSTPVLVTGATAANIDFRESILAKTPLVVAYVIALTFITLLVAFRSIVIPIKAVILNALSSRAIVMIPTIGQILARTARRVPDKRALICDEHELTYRELNAQVNQIAHGFQRSGIREDDRVALLFHNSIPLIELLLALAKTGITGIPLNFRLHARELSSIIEQSDATVLFAGEEFENIISGLQPFPSSLRSVISVGKSPGKAGGFYNTARSHPDTEPALCTEADRDSFIIYTSGTTNF